ncbi:MAG TPA: ABC transporter substrate-binding protein [Stellaceae bacterium]|nr:ABC transporter substrate-binding protein [Stellaceae bacterium]
MRVRTLLSATALLLAMAAPQAPARAAEPLKISVGWVVLSNDMAPLVFLKPDILKNYGKTYTVEATRFQGTSAEITALAAGELDIASLAYSSLPIAIENAHLDDMRIVSDGFQDGHPGYNSIEYRVRNDGSVNKIEDLKGKILAINVIGAAVDIGGRAVLADHGLMYPRDYSIVEANFPTIGPMLLEHKADIASVPPPFSYTPAVVQGTHTLFTMKDGMGVSQMIVMTARKGFLDKNRAALDDFFDDLVRGTHWMLNPSNRTAAIKFVADVTKQPEALYDSYFLTKKDQYHDPDAKPDLVALQRNIDAEVKFGFIKKSIDVKKYSDLSFVERAARRYAKEETASAH